MKKAKIVLFAVAGFALIVIIGFFFFIKGPDLNVYAFLKDPRIVKKDKERVLEVKFSGAAETVIKDAYTALFTTYYSLKDVPKGGPGMKPPKGRYQFDIDISKPAADRLKAIEGQPWKGSVAIPVPEGTTLPESARAAGVGLADWEYGEVAEILHLGSYETETPTIQRLEDYIKAQGYTVIGDHEEEYLKGPGMPFVKPEDYWTIIRYRVVK